MALSRNPLPALFVGPGGATMTEDEIKQARALETRRAMQGVDTSPVGHWTQGAARVADAIAGAFRRGALDRAEQANQAYDASAYGSLGDALAGGGDGTYTAADTASAPSTGRVTGNTNVNDPAIFDTFIGTVKEGGVTNPNALAAIAATGQHESAFSPKNVYGNWSDPSQSGRQLTAGGVMSWNGPRYAAMRNFVANNGGDPNRPDPALQAKYFLQEDPNLIASLNAAKSPEEAQHLMNNAWRFAGYDQPGGEAARRIASARQFASRFGDHGPTTQLPPEVRAQRIAQNQAGMANFTDAGVPQANPAMSGVGVQTASLDPSIGMPTQTRAGDVITVPPVEQVAGNVQTPASVVETPYQPTNADFTSDPRFSVAPNVPMVGPTGQPSAIAAAVNPAAVPASVQRVSGALPIRPMADPNDVMVADMAHTEQPQQPTGQGADYFPPAPSMGAPAAAQSGPDTALLVRAMTDPRASDKTRTIAKLIYEKQSAATTAAQKAIADRQQFVFEQQYKEGLPSTQADITAKQTDTKYKEAQIADMAKTGNIKDYDAYAADEAKAGRAPLGRLEYEQALRKAGATLIDNRQGEGNAFYNNLDAGNAKIFSDLSGTGVQARSNLGMVNQLGERLKNAPQGAVGALSQLAGEWGIKTEGSSDIEAATALINRLVPQQRQPGSGTMSDADLALFKASLPRILNTKGGNEMIISDLKAISDYQIKMGEIADQVADRTLTPAQGREAIRSLPNPLSDFLNRDRSAKMDEQDDGWKEISPGVKVREKK